MPPENRRRRKPAVPDKTRTSAELEKTPIAELSLPVRIVNALEESNILLVKDVLGRRRSELAGIRNFGDKTLKEIITAVSRLGLSPPADWLQTPRKKSTRPRRPKRIGLDESSFWG